MLAGEDSLTGALREVREELGVVLKPDTGRLLYSFRRDKASWENPGFLDVWLFETDVSIESVVLQGEETCDAMWADTADILRMMETGGFIPMQKHPYYLELFALFGE